MNSETQISSENLIHEYATAKSRATALGIDFAIAIPIIALGTYASVTSRNSSIAATILVSLLMIAYKLICHAKWGQTPGKMLAKIKVVRAITYANIDYKTSLKRLAVDCAIFAIDSFGRTMALLSVSSELYNETMQSGWSSEQTLDLLTSIEAANPIPQNFMYFSFVWFIASIVVLKRSKKKQAIHDFIADTVVIKTH